MEDIISQKELKPHDYPPLIKIIGVFIIGLFFYSSYIAPKYFFALKNFNAGERQLARSNYYEAITELKKVIAVAPSSKKAKVSLALAYFSNGNTEDDGNGWYYLQGMQIDKYDWKKLSKVAPLKYQEFITSIKK